LEPVKFKRRIRKSGGSAAVVIPPELLNALKWKIGDEVLIYIENGKLVIVRKRV